MRRTSKAVVLWLALGALLLTGCATMLAGQPVANSGAAAEAAKRARLDTTALCEKYCGFLDEQLAKSCARPQPGQTADSCADWVNWVTALSAEIGQPENRPKLEQNGALAVVRIEGYKKPFASLNCAKPPGQRGSEAQREDSATEPKCLAMVVNFGTSLAQLAAHLRTHQQ